MFQLEAAAPQFVHWNNDGRMGAPGHAAELPELGGRRHVPVSPRGPPDGQLTPRPPAGHPAQDSAVGFLLELDNGAKVQAHVFLCYAGARPASRGAGDSEDEEQFAW